MCIYKHYLYLILLLLISYFRTFFSLSLLSFFLLLLLCDLSWFYASVWARQHNFPPFISTKLARFSSTKCTSDLTFKNSINFSVTWRFMALDSANETNFNIVGKNCRIFRKGTKKYAENFLVRSEKSSEIKYRNFLWMHLHFTDDCEIELLLSEWTLGGKKRKLKPVMSYLFFLFVLGFQVPQLLVCRNDGIFNETWLMFVPLFSPSFFSSQVPFPTLQSNRSENSTLHWTRNIFLFLLEYVESYLQDFCLPRDPST